MPTITTSPKTGLFRTETVNSPPVRVDRAARVVFGCALMQRGDLNSGDSRNWTVTDETLQQAYQLSTHGNNGLKARFTHPNMSSDGMGSYLGRWKNIRLADGVLRADLHIADAAFKSPQGDLGTYVLEMADNDPDMFGVSLATELDIENLMLFEETSDSTGNGAARWDMRFAAVRAGDVVDEPAATRGGMFDLLTVDQRNLPAQATALLQTYFGDAEPAVVRARIDGFLDRYFSNKGAVMPDEQTASVEETSLETAAAGEQDTVTTQAEQPAGQDTATTPTTVTETAAADLSVYMSTFGDADGARMFRDKVPFQQAMIQHLTSLRGQIQDLSAENAQLKTRAADLARNMLGETEAVNVGHGETKKSLSEAFRKGPNQKPR